MKLARRSIILGLLVAAWPLAARVPQAQKPIPKILFICQFGTAKSAIAREMFRERARARGISITAFSRGITPGDHVSDTLRANLKADAINTTRDRLRALTPKDIKTADIVVAFNPLPPAMRATDLRDWSATPSVNDDYQNARAQLTLRIDALLDSLAKPR